MNKYLTLFVFLALIHCSMVNAQEAQFPIVKGFGGIYSIENAVELPDPNAQYKIVVELVFKSENDKEANRMVLNIARMMNLHGLAGVPKEQLEIVVLVHGPAAFTLLNDDSYKKLHQVNNPNIPVYQALKDAGARVIICGQSLIARDIPRDNLWEGTEVALSALTTITHLVNKGYMVFKF